MKNRNWTIDTNLDHHHLHDVLPPSKPPTATTSQVDLTPEEQIKEEDPDGVPEPKGPAQFPGNISPRMLWNLKRALVLKNSHIGGHKYAGNVIVSEHLFLDLFWLGPFSLSSAWIPILSAMRSEHMPPMMSKSSASPSRCYPIRSLQRLGVHHSDFELPLSPPISYLRNQMVTYHHHV